LNHAIKSVVWQIPGKNRIADCLLLVSQLQNKAKSWKPNSKSRSVTMAWFLYIISVVCISFGSCSILYTSETRNTSKKLLSSMNRIALSTLPLAVGILMIVSASASAHPWLVRVLGFIGLIKGVLVIANPNGMFDKALHWCFESVSDQGYRLMGIVTVILGTAILSWIA
jgi:hypothetical protein